MGKTTEMWWWWGGGMKTTYFWRSGIGSGASKKLCYFAKKSFKEVHELV